MRCLAIKDCFKARHVTHPMVGELSLNNVIRFSLRGPHSSSIASHSRSSPANSRSEFVMVPFKFLSNTTLVLIVSGHCHRKTVGVHAKSSPKITPPMPWLDASTIPTKSGQPQISSQHLVGSRVDSGRRDLHPSIALRTLRFLCRYTWCGRTLRTRLHGDSRPTPPGMHVNA
jgi:hypothetical protein